MIASSAQVTVTRDEPFSPAPLRVVMLVGVGAADHPAGLLSLPTLKNKSAAVIVSEEKTAARIRKLGYSDVTVLGPGESRLVSRLSVAAFPGSHPVPERTYVLSSGSSAVYFGGDTAYIKEFPEIGEKFDLTAALLPVNGVSLPFAGKVVMGPVDAAEAAVQLKTRVAIPIHYNMSFTVPLLRWLFERRAAGTPERFAEEVRRRNRNIKVVSLNPGESWETE